MAIRKRNGRYEVHRRIIVRVDTADQAKEMDTRLKAATKKVREEVFVYPRGCLIKDHIPEFLRELRMGIGRRRAICTATHKQYGVKLGTISDYFTQSVDSITDTDIARFLEAYSQKSATYRNELVRTLHMFISWAHKKKLCAEPKWSVADVKLPLMNRLKGKYTEPRVLSRGTWGTLFTLLEEKNKAILLFMRGMQLFGLRPAGVCKLNWGDVREPSVAGNGYLKLPVLKCGDPVLIPVQWDGKRHRWLLDCLALFKKEKNTIRKTDPLLIHPRKEHRDRGVRRWTSAILDREFLRFLKLKEVAKRVAVGNVRLTPYVLRHSILTWLAENEQTSSADRQAYAGHKRVTTQDVYIHYLGQDRSEVLDLAAEFTDTPRGRPTGTSLDIEQFRADVSDIRPKNATE